MPKGTTAATWFAEAYNTGAATPLKYTLVPPTVVGTWPLAPVWY